MGYKQLSRLIIDRIDRAAKQPVFAFLSAKLKVPAFDENMSLNMASRHLDLNGLYQRLSVAYSDLSRPDEKSLRPLNSELRHARRKADTLLYIATTATAVSFFITFPVLLFRGFLLLRSFQPALEHLLRQRSYLDSHPEVRVAALFAIFSSLVYTLLMQQRFFSRRIGLHISARFPKIRYPIREINQTGTPFLIYAALLDYAALGLGLLFRCSYSALGSPWTTRAVTAWMCVPLPVISLAPAFLLTFVYIYPYTRYELYDDAPQAALLRELLLLLDYLGDITDTRDVSSERRQTIMRRIHRIASMLRGLCSAKGTPHTSFAGVHRRFGQAADYFLALSTWIAFPKHDTLPELKRKVVSYANIIAAGTYDALPTSEVGEFEGLKKGSRRMAMWRQVGGLLGLFLVIASPLAVYAELAIHFRVEIPPNLSAPAGVVYSGWVALCLLVHIDRMSPDTKAALMDVIKLVRH